jgi:glycosyltransferase involved in cell wall biosynthesis
MFPVWEKWGHKVVSVPTQADVQLSVVRIGSQTPNLPIVVRIDGIYYDAGIDYNHANQSISRAHKTANAVIYQSNTSRKLCERYLSPRKGQYSVIHNGINADGWNSPQPHDGVNIFACGKWRRPKRLKETIKVFQSLRKAVPSAMLHIVGGFKKGGKPITSPNVTYHGQVDHTRMQELYRKGDAFIHLCRKDSCPSSVVEAMAAGLPVITTNACGGATEMCRITDGCVVVEGESETLEPEYIYTDEPHKLPQELVAKLSLELYGIIKNKGRVMLPEQLTIEHTAQRYLEVFDVTLAGCR